MLSAVKNLSLFLKKKLMRSFVMCVNSMLSNVFWNVDDFHHALGMRDFVFKPLKLWLSIKCLAQQRHKRLLGLNLVVPLESIRSFRHHIFQQFLGRVVHHIHRQQIDCLQVMQPRLSLSQCSMKRSVNQK